MLRLQRGRHAMRIFLRLLSSIVIATTIAGCADTPKAMGLPWWPQGSGETSMDALRASDAEPHGADHESASASTQPAGRDANAVRYGDLLFISGQVATDLASKGDIETQVRSAMDNVVRILESHGLAISNIVSVTLYMQDVAELPRADAAYASYFRRGLPARSVVGVNRLPDGRLVEIAAIAGK